MEPVDFDDAIDRRKWLARLMACVKGHARKTGGPFELTIEFIKTLYAQQKGAATSQGFNSTSDAFLMR
jgi:hypothetical protein